MEGIVLQCIGSDIVRLRSFELKVGMSDNEQMLEEQNLHSWLKVNVIEKTMNHYGFVNDEDHVSLCREEGIIVS
jgi:hypothetical protein